MVGGAAFIFSSTVEPGVIAYTGGPACILFGELDRRRTVRVEKLLAECREAGIDIPAERGGALDEVRVSAPRPA